MQPRVARVRGILFDLDGVLVDSRVPIARSINHALRRHGLEPLAEEALHGFIGPPLHETFRELLARAGADPAGADSCVSAYRERYAERSLLETEAVHGVGEVLEALAPRRALAVATSKPVEFAQPILETLGLARLFRAIVGPPLDPRGEPKRETVARALDALGLRDAALVGDRQHDVAAARANGIASVGVLWGIGSQAELVEAGAEHLVEAPGDLLRLFGAL
jgi:phosphoglycolate phosphatase